MCQLILLNAVIVRVIAEASVHSHISRIVPACNYVIMWLLLLPVHSFERIHIH